MPLRDVDGPHVVCRAQYGPDPLFLPSFAPRFAAIRAPVPQRSPFPGARTRLISGPALQLPMYQPENPDRSEAARDLVAQLALADGIILGSPGYHGSISELIKNALDYAEDLRADIRPYFSGRAVGCIATAGGWPGAVNTLGALRDIVHALRGWPTPLGAAINSSERVFDEHGECLVPRVAQILDVIADEVIDFLR